MMVLQPKRIAELRAHMRVVVRGAPGLLQRVSNLRIRRRDVVLIGCVLLLHVAFVLGIIWSLRVSGTSQAPKELALTLTPLATAPPLVSPAITLPDMPIDAPPDIVIDRDTPMTAPESASSTMVLPPRPDPAHPNPPPAIAGATAGLSVILKIFVQPDGSISEADIVRSSGQSGIDSAAVQFVEQNWRFQPAKLGARAIEFWTTVTVPIAST